MSASSAEPDPSSSTPAWNRIAERGSLWGMKFVAWYFRVMGRGPSLVLAHPIVAYFFLTDRAGRRASLAYLRRVHATPEGRAALGREPGLWQSFQHYRAFAVSIVDRLAIWFGRADDFDLVVHGSEHFDQVAVEGRGAIVVGAHLGSFDALRLLAVRRQTVVNVLMFTEHAQRINRIFREISPDSEAHVIQVDPTSVESVFRIRSCLARGEYVAILGDRVEASDRRRTVRVPLLGGRVELPEAPFLLASLLGCPLILALALRRGPRSYEIYAEKLADRVRATPGEREKVVEELLASYAERLEYHCTRTPYQWFNFFDYWGDAAP